MPEKSFHRYRHRKIQLGGEQKLYQRHLLFLQNPILLLYFQGLHLQVIFYLRVFHLKYLQLLALIHLLNHLLAQALVYHQTIHKFYHQVLPVLYFVFLHFLSLVFVLENYINYLLVSNLVAMVPAVLKGGYIQKIVIRRRKWRS